MILPRQQDGPEDCYLLRKYTPKVNVGWDVFKLNDRVYELPPGSISHLSKDMLQRADGDNRSPYHPTVRAARLAGDFTTTADCPISYYHDERCLFYLTAGLTTTLKYSNAYSNEAHSPEDIIKLPGRDGVLCTVANERDEVIGSYVMGVFKTNSSTGDLYKRLVFRKDGFAYNIDLPAPLFRRIERVLGKAKVTPDSRMMYYHKGELYATLP